MSAPAPAGERLWALLVGVDHYSPEWGFSPLPQTQADVAGLAAALAQLTPPFSVRALAGGGATRDLPTFANIGTELERLAINAQAGDTLLFYFSGHGVSLQGTPSLVPLDGRRDRLEPTTLPLPGIQQVLSRSAAAVTLIVLDMCHAAPEHKGLVDVGDLGEGLDLPAAGQLLLAASRHDQLASVDERSGRSIFTHFLIEGLKGGAADDGGHIPLRRLYTYVAGAVRTWAFTQGRALQTPVLIGRQEGEILLGRALARPTPPGLQGEELVGRRRELEALCGLVVSSPLVTVRGLGGIGKTRLARAAMSELRGRFTHGACWVGLADHGQEVDVAALIAHGLDLPLDARAADEVLLEWLADRATLLVLDNAEHVVETLAPLLEELLPACPGLKVLVTSRVALGLAAEWVWELGPLDLPPIGAGLAALEGSASGSLLLHRARRARSDLMPTPETCPAWVSLCRGLEGVPLAIELAAARLRVLTPPQLVERLSQRLRWLSTHGGVEPRHRSLRATLEASWALLGEDEQRLMARLAVFVGGCELDAVEVIAATAPLDPVRALDLLTDLADHSLMVVDLQGLRARYRMLEVVRDFAAEKLLAEQDVDELRLRHSRWYLAAASRQLHRDRQAPLDRALESLDAERGNLEEALATLLRARAYEELAEHVRLLCRYWMRCQHGEDAFRWLHRLLELGEGAISSRARVEILLMAVMVERRYGHLERTLKLLDEVDRRCEAPDMEHARMRGAFQRAWVEMLGGAPERALVAVREGLLFCRRVGDAPWLGLYLTVCASAARNARRPEEAEVYLSEKLAHERQTGEAADSLASTLVNLAELRCEQGDLDQADLLCQEAEGTGGIQQRSLECYVLLLRARLHRRRGELPLARRSCERALETGEVLREVERLGLMMDECVLLALAEGDDEAGRRLWRLGIHFRAARGIRIWHIDAPDLALLQARLPEAIDPPRAAPARVTTAMCLAAIRDFLGL